MLYLALPLETPWDHAGALISFAPVSKGTYTTICRVSMGVSMHHRYDAIRAQARLSDALVGMKARHNKKRVWTFPQIGAWLAEGAVYDELLGVCMARIDAPVETHRRHVRAWLPDDEVTAWWETAVWGKEGWWKTCDNWEIIHPARVVSAS